MAPPGKDGAIPQLFSIFYGEVASLQAYGAFIRIPNCKKQGLVHKSQMSSARIEDPSEMLAKGERVYCKVIGMEGEGEKISLSMKVVSQTTGEDLDPNNIQLDQDSKKRRQWKHIGKDKIELGAELNTICKRCGGHGHLTMDCFAGKDGTQYELIPDIETLTQLPSAEDILKSYQGTKKKKKKDKKKKSKRKRSISSGSDGNSTSDDGKKSTQLKKSSKKKHNHGHDSHKSRKEQSSEKQRHRSSSSSHSESPSPYHSHDKEIEGRTRPSRDKESSKRARRSRSQDKKEGRDKRKREDSSSELRNSWDYSSSGNIGDNSHKRSHSHRKASAVKYSHNDHSDFSSAESDSHETKRQQRDVREKRKERRSGSEDRHKTGKVGSSKDRREEMQDYSQYSKDRGKNESWSREEKDRHREGGGKETHRRKTHETDKKHKEHRSRRKEQYSD